MRAFNKIKAKLTNNMLSPHLLIIGGCLLSFGAAFANIGLLLQTGTSVSHLTGDISKLTINATHGDSESFQGLYAVSVATICFLLGAMTAGFFVHHPTLDFSRPYGRSITGIGFLFIAASFLVDSSELTSIGLAALGCGLQNALASHYRGLILRTTHLTGIFTDLGISIGMRLRGHEVAGWKIIVPACLTVSFCAGGYAAASLELANFNTIWIAGIGYCIAGLAWTIWKHELFTGK